jgi:hypothetical protein
MKLISAAEKFSAYCGQTPFTAEIAKNYRQGRQETRTLPILLLLFFLLERVS